MKLKTTLDGRHVTATFNAFNGERSGETDFEVIITLQEDFDGWPYDVEVNLHPRYTVEGDIKSAAEKMAARGFTRISENRMEIK